MKKKTLESLAILGALVFIWPRLGLKVPVREYPSKYEVGHMSQAEWQSKYGGSYLDYQDWLKGQ